MMMLEIVVHEAMSTWSMMSMMSVRHSAMNGVDVDSHSDSPSKLSCMIIMVMIIMMQLASHEVSKLTRLDDRDSLSKYSAD